ncbi:MAG: CHAT domain-containing tetratricopeptide repeat protein [Phycisphaerales bacterium]
MSDATTTQRLDALIADLVPMDAAARAARLRRESGEGPGDGVDSLIEAIAQRGSDLAIGDTPAGERAARLAVELADAHADSRAAPPGSSTGVPAGPGGGAATCRSLSARARVALAHVLNYATRFEEALACLDEASAAATSAGDTFASARASLIAMHALARLGRMDEALGAGDRAVAGFAAVDEAVWRAKADVNVGVIKRMRDDPAGALAHFDAARETFAEAPPILAQIESNRAEALLDLGRFGEAEGAFASSLAAFEAAGIARAAAIAEGNLADLLSRQGRLEESLERFERARRTLEGANAPADLARLRAEEADTLATVGLLEESATAYREALEALGAAGLAAEGARAKVGLAQVLARFGRLDDAAGQLEAAIVAFEAIPNPTGAARAGVLLARLRLARGRRDEATALLDRFENVLRERPLDALAGMSVRAAIARGAGAMGPVIETLSRAIDLATGLGNRPVLADLLHERAGARRASDDLPGAIEDLERAIELTERVRALLHADRLRAAALGSRADIYDDAVAALLELARLELAGRRDGDASALRARAFETADRAKARALLDSVGGRFERALPGDRSGADGVLGAELERRRSDMNAIYAALFAPQERRLSPATQRELASRLDEHERRVSEIERRMAASGGGVLAAPVASLAQVQGVLREGEALVEFFGADDALGVAVVTHSGLHVRAGVAMLDEVADLGERLTMAIDRSVIALAGAGARGGQSGSQAIAPTGVKPAAVERLLTRLHEIAIAPIEPLIAGATRLLLVPHGPLHALPLHAARSEHGPLVDRFEVASIPSAAFLHHVRTRRTDSRGAPARDAANGRSTSRPLVVGVPDEVAPEMGDEAEAVARAIPDARLLVGSDATFEAFAAAAPGSPLIHLACHGVFAARNPLQARLRFSDRWVTVRDLLPLDLSGAVVVLSGCETGKAGVERGDEAYGLGRAVLAAGASAALLSLWPVHDRTTRELMISMYQEAFAGYLPVEAGAAAPGPCGAACAGGPDLVRGLARAQRSLAAQGRHPAVWAPFVVLGDPTP